MTDDDLLRRVRLADPLAGREDAGRDSEAVLRRVLAVSRSAALAPAGRRFRAVLVVALGVAVLLVPAAVGFHRQLLDLMRSPPSAYAGDLPGVYTAVVTGLKPPSRNGRWAISFTNAYSHMGAERGGYRLVHRRRLVAEGEYSWQYSSVGPMVHLRDMSGPGQCNESMIGGNYTVVIRGRKLILEPFADRCVKRRVVLGSRTFVRAK